MKRCSCPDGIEELRVENCSSMTVVSFPKGGHEKLRSLCIGQEMNSRSSFRMLENELVIINCPKLDGSSFVGDKLTSLEKLHIYNCRSMDAALPGWVWPPNLRSLKLGQLKKPFSEWGPQKKFPTSLVNVELFGGDGEDGKVSLHPQHHTSFQYLSFEDCPNLMKVSLHPQHLTSIQHLTFEKCPNLEEVCLHPQHPTSIHHLSFQDCPKMKDLPELMFPSLLSLHIGGDCPDSIVTGSILQEICQHSPQPDLKIMLFDSFFVDINYGFMHC
ncbi:hypothetical protein M8C21_032614 [Ambrosia artemisiifolia]|uniref:Uncharacterized protein n=1 Tax=Ambrosia artemisiifolia TaxID=4212 RepID=A0AAD5BRH9_AMBAR|nr:hypothetical protein M8C21_032614 [Ambrosia artemisiifolia]